MTELSLGHFAGLAAAFANALSTVLVRKIGGTERSAVLILYPMLFSMTAMSLTLPVVYVPVELTDLGLMASIGFLSVIAQLFIISAYRAAPAAVVAPLQYSQILWATFFGALFFMETPDIYVAVGSSIIILSGIFVVWRESRENVSEQTPVLKTANPRFDAGPQPK